MRATSSVATPIRWILRLHHQEAFVQAGGGAFVQAVAARWPHAEPALVRVGRGCSRVPWRYCQRTRLRMRTQLDLTHEYAVFLSKFLVSRRASSVRGTRRVPSPMRASESTCKREGASELLARQPSSWVSLFRDASKACIFASGWRACWLAPHLCVRSLTQSAPSGAAESPRAAKNTEEHTEEHMLQRLAVAKR